MLTSSTMIVLLLLSGGGGRELATCQGSGSWTSTCSVSNSGSSVDISGSQTKHASKPKGGGSNHAVPEPAPSPSTCLFDRCGLNYDVVLLRDVTLADLASFTPAKPTLAGEPDGAAIVGMPANLVARAAEQRIPGRLFDFDVTVRFVPAGFRFDHGDGTSRTATTGGATWTTLRQADFTPTATSHVYARKGTYDVAVTVLYRASVDFGNGWRPVDRFVEATTAGYRVRVVEAHTALVDKTCLENPRGPGC